MAFQIIIGALFALACTAGGAYQLVRFWGFLQRGVRVEGMVLGASIEDRGAKYPVVSFMDQHGKTHVVKSKVGSDWAPKKGTEMNVRYNPDNPKDVILGSLVLSFIARLLLLLVGIAGIVFAVMAYKSL